MRRTATSIERMLCNPFYTGIRVSPKLTADRPAEYDRALFLATAIEIANEFGTEQCIRRLLSELRDPQSNWTLLLPVHPCFGEEHKSLMTVEEFVSTALAQIRERHLTVERYFGNVADNLAELAMPLELPQGARR